MLVLMTLAIVSFGDLWGLVMLGLIVYWVWRLVKD